MRKVEEKGNGAASLLGVAVAIVTRPLVWLLHCLLGRPRDSVLAILVASSVSAIVINSLFLQHGRHPAPIFTHVRQMDLDAPRAVQIVPASRVADAHASVQPPPTVAEQPTGAVIAALPRERPPEAPPRILPISARTVPAHKDPIAEILAPTQRLTAIQQALSEYGYGQVRPNGTMGPDTRAAIERFERERSLPVTGQVSDRLVRELSQLTGRQI
ncbi:MAG: peptidoglycan-binding domain-containing protein [Xanthobacteraceae bacterium]